MDSSVDSFINIAVIFHCLPSSDLSPRPQTHFIMSTVVDATGNSKHNQKRLGWKNKEEKVTNNVVNISRQLRIKTGIVKRLTKDVVSYQAEADIQQVRLEKMKEEERDEYDIKKMGQVVQESLMMIPHCLRKLKIANEDLKQLTNEYKYILQVKRNEEKNQETELERLYQDATEHISEAEDRIRDQEKD